MAGKHLYFDGKMFTRDERTGYYLCSTKNSDGVRKRMHVYVWEFYNGPVPEGYHVHHIDEDKSNNDISNLKIMPGSDHVSMHGKEMAENNYDKMIDNLNANARPKANEWHRSESGREWHKMHYKSMSKKLYKPMQFSCENCGKLFTSTQVRSRFCSNNCKSAWRRKSGVDDIVKICEDCGGEYRANKYASTKYCSVCKNRKHSRGGKRRRLQHGSAETPQF